MLGVSVAAAAVFSIPISAYYDVSILPNVERNVTGFECAIVKPTTLHRVTYTMYNGIMLLATIGILITMAVLYTLILKSMMKRSATFKARESRRQQLREMADANTGDFSSEDFLNSSSQVPTTGEESVSRNSQFNMVNLANEKHPRTSMIIDKDDRSKQRESIATRNSCVNPQIPKRKRKANYQAVKNHFSTHLHSSIFLHIHIDNFLLRDIVHTNSGGIGI